MRARTRSAFRVACLGRGPQAYSKPHSTKLNTHATIRKYYDSIFIRNTRHTRSDTIRHASDLMPCDDDDDDDDANAAADTDDDAARHARAPKPPQWRR